MADVKIDARPNGPYVVTGSIELRDTNGNVLATQERTVLCRCGASTTKRSKGAQEIRAAKILAYPTLSSTPTNGLGQYVAWLDRKLLLERRLGHDIFG